MYYLKTLVINFLVIFFADHILPGLQVTDQTRLPHIGGDLIFAAALGFLNSLIYPVLRMLKHDVSVLKIGLMALILNFAAYGIVKLLPLGIDVMTIEGYLLVSIVVALGCFLTNFFEMKRHRSHKVDMPQ